MVVYADVLFFFNCIIDYFLIGISAVLVKTSLKNKRQIIAALLGGLSSFYIFIDADNFFLDALYRLVTTLIIIATAFGLKRMSNFLKATASYFISSLFLFGITFFIYSRFKLPKIVINNTYFYYDFSPLFAIFLTSVIYLIIKIIRRFSSKKISYKECEIEFNLDDNYITAKGYIDTGSLAKDYFSDSELCFVNKELFYKVTGCIDFSQIILTPRYKKRYRAIPVTTLNETTILEGLRCDGGRIIVREEVYFLYKPIIVLSNNLPPNYDVLISAKTLEKSPDKILKVI